MFDFPNTPVEGQVFSPVGGPSYAYKSGVWRNSDQQVMGDTWWPDRPSFVTAVAAGMPIQNGKIYTAGGFLYVGKLGQTAITDLPNLLPLGDVHVEHFGAVADMTWELAAFTATTTFQETGKFFGPYRLTGTNQRAAFEAADNYVNSVYPAKGEFFIDGGVAGNAKSGYFIDGQFILKSMMRSKRDFRTYLWANTSNVYHSNIVITAPDPDPFAAGPRTRQQKRGAKGFIEICQYSYSGVAKPFGHGCIGCGISIGSALAPTGGVAIAIKQPAVVPPMPLSNTHVPFMTDVEIDVRFVRAGHGSRVGGGSQTSNASYLFFGVGGIENCYFKLGIREQTNKSSNGLGICHWNLMYSDSAGGDPLTNYSAMIPTETFHCCDTKVEFADEINMFDTPHGFQCAWEFASSGHTETGPISVAGCSAVSISPGDLINHYTNPAQKEKVGKAIKVGKINGVDIPIGGDTMTPYANGAGANLYLRGFGTSKFDNDIYETTTTRNVCRQLECDVTYEGFSLVRTGKNGFVPRWNGRAFYAQGVQGKLTVGAMTTFGIGRGYEIEYCDGDQSLSYIEGDGCLLYEFSRGGRLLQTDTNRNVANYVENPNDGSYRPGMGPNTRAISIGGGTYSTVVDTTLGPDRVNTTTKTYIVPFGGADDDVYRGTPLQIGDQWVTATQFIQGRSAGGSGVIQETGVSIVGVSQANPGVITAPANGFASGTWVVITGVQGMSQINSREGRLIRIDDAQFNLETIDQVTGNYTLLDTTGFSPYTGGGTVTQKLPTRPIALITQANAAAITTSVDHGFAPKQVVGIYNVVGLNVATPGTAYTVTKISKGNPARVTVDAANIKQFAVNQEVTIAGGDASHAAANGRKIIGDVNLTTLSFSLKEWNGTALVNVDTSAAAADQTTGTMTAAPHKSGINGKQGQVTFVDDRNFTINIDTLVTPALTPYVPNTGGAMEVYEGVGYLEHTPLTVPAVNGQKVTVNEFCRVKQGSITSVGGEAGVRLLTGGIDLCDMHGLRSTGKYGVLMTNGRLSMNGPMPLTVGVNPTVAENFTIKGDGKSLFSAADGTIDDNPHVAYHIFMDKDSSTGSTGHADIRHCRVSNIAKLMEGNASKLRFALTLHGCTDTQINQLLSHPARQGKDEDQVVGGKGYYQYSDDGKLECWVTDLQSDAAGNCTWTFPAPFNGGAATIEVSYTPTVTLGSARSFSTVGRASTHVNISVAPAGAVGFSARAVGRWFADSPTTPTITSISPSSWPIGDAFKTVTITGTGFDPTSVFFFGNVAQPTTFVSTTQLTAGLNTSPYGSAQTVPAQVWNSGLGSNIINYSVT